MQDSVLMRIFVHDDKPFDVQRFAAFSGISEKDTNDLLGGSFETTHDEAHETIASIVSGLLHLRYGADIIKQLVELEGELKSRNRPPRSIEVCRTRLSLISKFLDSFEKANLQKLSISDDFVVETTSTSGGRANTSVVEVFHWTTSALAGLGFYIF
jgi:hypothetical protein